METMMTAKGISIPDVGENLEDDWSEVNKHLVSLVPYTTYFVVLYVLSKAPNKWIHVLDEWIQTEARLF